MMQYLRNHALPTYQTRDDAYTAADLTMDEATRLVGDTNHRRLAK